MSQQQKELYIENLIHSDLPITIVRKAIEDIEDSDCELCGGIGEMPDYYFDEDSHEWYEDGTKKCLCKLNLE